MFLDPPKHNEVDVWLRTPLLIPHASSSNCHLSPLLPSDFLSSLLSYSLTPAPPVLSVPLRSSYFLLLLCHLTPSLPYSQLLRAPQALWPFEQLQAVC